MTREKGKRPKPNGSPPKPTAAPPKRGKFDIVIGGFDGRWHRYVKK